MVLYDALTKFAKQQGQDGPEYYLIGQVAAVSVVKCGKNLVAVQGTGEQENRFKNKK